MLNKYHVTYYYLATGMEGQADERDFGIIEANSKLEAMEYIVNNRETFRKAYDLETNKCHRHWGLTAELVATGSESELKDECYYWLTLDGELVLGQWDSGVSQFYLTGDSDAYAKDFFDEIDTMPVERKNVNIL